MDHNIKPTFGSQQETARLISSSECDPPKPSRGKRLVHCSDGVIEESEDESIGSSDAEREIEEMQRSKVPDPASYAPRWIIKANPKQLSWRKWVTYKSLWFCIYSLHYTEVIGEKLAWFLGITSAKYSWEIAEYRRRHRIEREKRLLEAAETEKVREIAMRILQQSGAGQLHSAENGAQAASADAGSANFPVGQNSPFKQSTDGAHENSVFMLDESEESHQSS